MRRPAWKRRWRRIDASAAAWKGTGSEAPLADGDSQAVERCTGGWVAGRSSPVTAADRRGSHRSRPRIGALLGEAVVTGPGLLAAARVGHWQRRGRNESEAAVRASVSLVVRR